MDLTKKKKVGGGKKKKNYHVPCCFVTGVMNKFIRVLSHLYVDCETISVRLDDPKRLRPRDFRLNSFIFNLSRFLRIVRGQERQADFLVTADKLEFYCAGKSQKKETRAIIKRGSRKQCNAKKTNTEKQKRKKS